VWFNETLWPNVLEKIDAELEKCDLFVVIGTSAVVYPAAGFAAMLSTMGIPVANVNIEETSMTSVCKFHFNGTAGEWVPKMFAP